MLCFVNDQRHWIFGRLYQSAQGIGQGGAIDPADFGGVDLEATHTDALQPGRLGRFGHQAELLHKSTAYGLRNQAARITLLVSPQIHINRDHLAPRQFGHEV